ncbi:hypothetical protein [Actomonas aquatica]|uniref:Uncharacterized protein n=1 Tax=Actomonas aquatica TaxID=2866162 RepID=A0ABZ1C5F9_9BACT|nr:hypothetical protein [Opitutus sp. WL0086]WRQ85530.1 hypothetical protein K1X11_012025 [Opitutus sp. WL0086]
MRPLLTLAFSFLLVTTGVAQESAAAASEVVVAKLPSPIPDSDRYVGPSFTEADKFVWDFFTKRPEISRFNGHSTKDWESRVPGFRDALLTKAKAEDLEFEALNKCLDLLVESEVWTDYSDQKIAYLPISAYRGKKGDTDVWVLLCLWEYADPITEEYRGVDPETFEDLEPRKVDPPEWLPIAHVRMFTYEVESLKLIGYVTCD